MAEADDRLAVEYGERVVVFEGAAAKRLLPALLPLLDGTRTLGQIAAVIGDAVRPAVENALRALAAHGLLTEGPASGPDDAAAVREATAFLAATAHDERSPRAIQEALCVAEFGVAGDGRLAELIAHLLRLSGGSTVEHVSLEGTGTRATAPSLTVVAPDAEQLSLLQAWNDTALRREAAWLLVLPFNGRFASVGPLFLPGETCCYQCFRLRRASSLEYGPDLELLERTTAPPRGGPAPDTALAGLAAMAALRFVATGDRVLPGAFTALELGAVPSLSFHRVYRVPRCTTCSGLAGMAAPLPWFKVASRDAA